MNGTKKKKKNQSILDIFEDKKERNIAYFEMTSGVKKQISVTDKTLERVERCGTYMQFLVDNDLEKFKLEKANNCGNRFCPRCSWLKARKDAVRLASVVNEISKNEKKEFIFLTLTVPNVAAEELEPTIRRMNKSFERLYKRKNVAKVVKGFFRKLEVTYNGLSRTYHPHFHVLIVVNKSYFSDRTYIKRDDWLEMWQQSCRDTSITQVDVRKMKSTDYDDIVELTKYSAKDTDYLLYGDDVFVAFYKALKGKQLTVGSGLIKDYLKKFDNGEIEVLGEKETEYVYRIIAQYQGDCYRYDVRKLDAEHEES